MAYKYDRFLKMVSGGRRFQIAISMAIILLIVNLNAIIDLFLHPAIPYFDTEHLIVGGITGLACIMLFAMVIIHEEKLRKNEVWHRTILWMAMDGICLIDIQGRLLEVNGAFCRMSGYSESELLTMRIHDFEASETADETTDRIRKIIVQGEDRFESRHRRKDGTIYDVEVRVQCLHTNDEQFMVFLHDISERKRVEESLRESEQRFKKIFEEAHLGIVITLPSFIFEKANPAFCRMMGYSENELRSMTFADITHPDYLDQDRDNVRKVGRGEMPFYETEKRYINKSREILWGNLIVSSIRNEHGTLLYYLSMVYDITERKRAEEALKKSEQRFRELAEMLPESVYETDNEGTLTFVNRNAFAQFGYTEEDFTRGFHMLNVIVPDDHGRARENIQKIMNGEPVELHEYTLLKKDGSTFPALVHSAPIMHEDKPVGLRGFIIDIAKRKQIDDDNLRLQKRLQRAERMESLGQLAGGVAHDLNNVLGVLSGYSELLLEKIATDNPMRKYVENILKAVDKGAAIIQDLLTLARRGVVISEVANVNSIVSNLLTSPEFDRLKDYHPGVTITADLGKNLLNIKGSPIHLEKTVFNLVSNAAEAIDGSGKVHIRTENRYLNKAVRGYDEVHAGDYIVLTVSDTGRGIPSSVLDKIFEPFFTKKTMGRSGTGLGLAIVWGTVKDHEGYIDVQSAEGEGTTFTLYFPVTRETVDKEIQKIPVERYMGHGESILVVDDVQEQRDVATALLVQLGYQVTSLPSGEEAVAYLKSNKADILILDMIMQPGIDGFETYKRIITINPNQKAIIVSGFSETDRVKEAQKLGAGAYVRKPYMKEKLGVAIRDELNR